MSVFLPVIILLTLNYMLVAAVLKSYKFNKEAATNPGESGSIEVGIGIGIYKYIISVN